jgi:hypothetical protein
MPPIDLLQKTHRVNVNFGPDTYEKAIGWSKRRGMTISELLRAAVSLIDVIWTAQADGYEIILQHKTRREDTQKLLML